MTTVEGLQEAVSAVAEQVGKRVVGVAGRRSAGSGVVLAPGRILTNAHNLWGDETTVTFADGRTATAKAVGVDTEGDVAVLEVDTGDAAPIEWDGSGDVGIGSPVFAVANPGGRGLRVTFGLVSGTERSFPGPRGRRIAGSIEHTAPLLPGSSGGPVVDASGRFVGLNTHRLGEGFYLAIPADDSLRSRVDALSRGDAPKRVRLGIAIAPSHVARRLRRAVGLPEADGLLVRGVEEGSPADKAGIKEGDLVTTAGGTAVKSADDLFSALEGVPEGGSLELKILRGADEQTIRVGFTK
ncbi:MAG TPA: trypsin-like peptidase domain-containing protein [Actinomycetota bacterium]|jgi:serine protease Do|nr:trypsin-like peptidase domain-containing protein [Actinomycetota bacterium]